MAVINGQNVGVLALGMDVRSLRDVAVDEDVARHRRCEDGLGNAGVGAADPKNLAKAERAA